MVMVSVAKAKGMTLIEVMLVLVIASSIALMGIRMYQAAETDKNYFVLKTNVDMLFQAMKQYYQAECDLYFSADGSLSGKGALTFNPTNASPPTALVPVTFDVTKVNNYIEINWPRYTPVISNSTSLEDTYFAQFNPSEGNHKKAYACSSYATGSPQCEAPSEIQGSSIVLWQSQIAVKMKDPTKTTYYRVLVGADCAVNTIPSDGPVNCAAGVAMGDPANYMVWQRMPSFSSSGVRSSNWVSNPVTKEFKLQYTHDPMYELYNTSAEPNDVYKYYYCGG